MQNSKLIDLLKTFEKEDWRWFRKFLLSPYFNNREELVIFCDYLRKQAPDFKEKTIRKEKVFKKIYPGQNYDEKQISYAMNFLLGQAERFLVQKEFEENSPLMINYLQKSLVDRQLDKHYKYHYEKSLKILNQRKNENIDYFLHKYQMSEIATLHYTNQNLRTFDNNLQISSNVLDDFFILNKIRCCCEMLNRSAVMNAVYEPALEDEVIKFVERKKNIENPVILAYLEAYYNVKERKC